MNESPLPPGPEASDGSAARAERKPVRAWLWFVLVAALASGGYYFYDRHKAQTLAAAKEAASKKGFGKGLGGPTPVVAVPALKAPINVFLDGLGTVTPLRTVTVRSRVEGQLMRVHFDEGERVKQGQLLAEIDPRPFEVMLTQAEGQLARDQALLANARIDVERYRTLLAQDSIAKQQVDAQEALVRQYEGIVKSDQGQVESARLQLSYAHITAPITGRVGLRQVDPGNIVRGADANGIVVITQLAPIGVLFTVPQDSLPALMKRTRADERLPVEAWDREQKTRLAQGSLLAVDNLVDVATGTIKLKAQFKNAGSELFPNQFVNVRLKLETLEEQTVIAQSAVQRGGRGLFVYVVKDDMTVTARPVELGPADGPRVSVVKGIKPGERVVVDGIDRLREGTRVSLAKRPEYKPSVDGGSGARKKGKGKGKASEASTEKSSAEAGSEEAPKKKRRRKPPAESQDGTTAPARQ
ncbi:MAG: MdtA/MuxA family multidrug efflux RND transporter periplasmic adaptor subunit [Betaproteobacteria bacterium]|nr:MdtA/MuxA family multidrug efflux RND transporter periplasmic adaptor subunit [Betaproteobacteria bacterium]